MGGFFSKSQAPDQDKQETNQLSKNARKRLAKDAKWHAQAEGRKAYLKEKRKAVKQRRKENPQQLDRKRVPKIDQSSSGIKVMLDLDFTTLMSRKEISSSARQLSHCYSRNRYPAKNIKMSACGVDGLWTKELQTSYPGYTRWKDFEFSTIPLQEMTGNFCYLTADSPNILADLDEDVTYVIGGIVDRNRYKNLTLNKAEELNIAHARLPLDDFVKMSSRKVLTVNHGLIALT